MAVCGIELDVNGTICILLQMPPALQAFAQLAAAMEPTAGAAKGPKAPLTCGACPVCQETNEQEHRRDAHSKTDNEADAGGLGIWLVGWGRHGRRGRW